MNKKNVFKLSSILDSTVFTEKVTDSQSWVMSENSTEERIGKQFLTCWKNSKNCLQAKLN